MLSAPWLTDWLTDEHSLDQMLSRLVTPHFARGIIILYYYTFVYRKPNVAGEVKWAFIQLVWRSWPREKWGEHKNVVEGGGVRSKSTYVSSGSETLERRNEFSDPISRFGWWISAMVWMISFVKLTGTNRTYFTAFYVSFCFCICTVMRCFVLFYFMLCKFLYFVLLYFILFLVCSLRSAVCICPTP